MTEPGAPTTYAAVAAAGGVSIWGVSLETLMGFVVWALTIAVLGVRLWVDVRRLRKRKERDR